MFYFTVKLLVLTTLGYVCSNFSRSEIKSMLDSIHGNENRIVRILEQPTPDDSATLMQYLDKFNEELVQLVSAIKEPNHTLSDVKSLCVEGPKFLKLKLDNDRLRKSFNWSETDLEEMYYMFGVSDVMWFELKQLDPSGKHYPIVDNLTREELSYLTQMDKENRLNEFMEFTKLDDLKRTDVPPKKSIVER